MDGDTDSTFARFAHCMSAWYVCKQKDATCTCFVAGTLAASAKVKGFSHCQLSQVGVCLINVAGSPFRNELVKCVTIVGNAPLDLQHTLLGSESGVQVLRCR